MLGPRPPRGHAREGISTFERRPSAYETIRCAKRLLKAMRYATRARRPASYGAIEVVSPPEQLTIDPYVSAGRRPPRLVD